MTHMTEPTRHLHLSSKNVHSSLVWWCFTRSRRFFEFDQSHPRAWPRKGLEIFLRFVGSSIEYCFVSEPFHNAIALLSDTKVFKLVRLRHQLTLPFWHTINGADAWSTGVECHVSNSMTDPSLNSSTHWGRCLMHHIQSGPPNKEKCDYHIDQCGTGHMVPTTMCRSFGNFFFVSES